VIKLILTNYRPTSLLTGFYKQLEMLMFQRLNQHLQSEDILVPRNMDFERDYQPTILHSSLLIPFSMHGIRKCIFLAFPVT
jgi:hypothetical protein